MNQRLTMNTMDTTEALRMIEESAAQRREHARVDAEQRTLAAQEAAAQLEKDLSPVMSILCAASDKWPQHVAAPGGTNNSGYSLAPYSARLFGRESVRSHSNRTLNITMRSDRSVMIRLSGRFNTEEVHANSVADLVPKVMDLIAAHLS